MSSHDSISRDVFAWMLGLFALYTIVEHVFRLRLRSYVRYMVSSAGMCPEDTVFLVSAIIALSPLLQLRTDPITALLVSAASLTVWTMAWNVARLPPALPGNDLVVEQFVDDQIRFERSFTLLWVVPAATFLFFLWTPYVSGPWFLNNTVLGLASNFWLLVLMIVRWNIKRRSTRQAGWAGWPVPHG
jgi:hypothetical protein